MSVFLHGGLSHLLYHLRAHASNVGFRTGAHDRGVSEIFEDEKIIHREISVLYYTQTHTFIEISCVCVYLQLSAAILRSYSKEMRFVSKAHTHIHRLLLLLLFLFLSEHGHFVLCVHFPFLFNVYFSPHPHSHVREYIRVVSYFFFVLRSPANEKDLLLRRRINKKFTTTHGENKNVNLLE